MASQVGGLIRRQLKHEVLWKATEIAFHRPVQGYGLDAAEHCQIGVQQHFLTAREVNEFLDPLDRDELRYVWTVQLASA